MEGVKKEGIIKRFIKWLGTPEEDDIVNDEINVQAFSDEGKELLEELNKQTKKVDNMGNKMFTDRVEQRKETINNVKANVKQPTEKGKHIKPKATETMENEHELG